MPQPESLDRGKRCAATGEEQIGGRARRDQTRASGCQIAIDGGDGFSSQGHDAFLVALADDVDESGVQMELLQARVAQFGKAQAGRVGQFEHGLIAEGCR